MISKLYLYIWSIGLYNKNLSFVISIIITLIIVFGSIYFTAIELINQRVIYLLIDDSEYMLPLWENVETQIKIALTNLPDNIKLGLVVFDGETPEEKNDNGILQIVEPSTKNISTPQILHVLDKIRMTRPHKEVCFHKPVMNTLTQFLSKNDNIKQIVVITSEADKRCGLIDHKNFEMNMARNIPDVDIDVISIDDNINDQKTENNIFKNYAYRYTYWKIKVDNLASSLEQHWKNSLFKYNNYYKYYNYPSY